MNQRDTINEILKEKGLTQTDLAKTLELDQPRVSRLMKNNGLNEKQLSKTATLLSLSLDELMDRLTYEPEESEYIKKLESDIKYLEELKLSLQKINEKNEKLLDMQEKEIQNLKEKLSYRN